MPRFSALKTSVIRCLTAVALCLVFAGAAARDAPVLLVLGDSLSAAYGMPLSRGWVSLLEQRLRDANRPWRVVNASISGDTTSGALKRLPKLLELHAPKVVIIELGGNDGLQGKPLDAIASNLQGLIGVVRGAGAQPALVRMRIPPNYGRYYTGEFERLYEQIAVREEVPLLRFDLEGLASAEGMMQEDGIHPAPEAQARMLDSLWPDLNARLLSLERDRQSRKQSPGS
ncbi:MAG: arylesterase [Gammaproteobacteria bacterium]|nr:arylesterase [Gammaproteobacteria bacterium]MDE0488570.1 arylesterase [Gammaproteobacteria bacterium]MYH34956.1 arylesterase [Gammaproteobacteria bacterium]